MIIANKNDNKKVKMYEIGLSCNPVSSLIYLLLDWFYDAPTILATQQELKDIRNVFNECEG